MLDDPSTDLIVRQQRSASAARGALSSPKTQNAHRAETSQQSSFPASTTTLRGVLDEECAGTATELPHSAKSDRHSPDVSDHHDFRTALERPLQRRQVR